MRCNDLQSSFNQSVEARPLYKAASHRGQKDRQEPGRHIVLVHQVESECIPLCKHAQSETGSCLKKQQNKTKEATGAGIMEADDRRVTTVFTVQPSSHYRP